MFTLATKEVGFVKGSFFGPGGTGKTTLLAMMLLYLSKTYHNSAPVAWLASEKGVDFVVDIFEAEGVPLLLNRTRSFLDLRSASRDAIEQGCCAIGVDAISHYWAELFNEGMNGKNATGPRLQRIARIKEEWSPFAQDFQDSPIHFLVTGRMGFVWDEIEMPDDKGVMQREISKSGTKIKAEGDFNHEPDLVIETAQIEDPDFVRFEKVGRRARKTFKSQILHVATVKKCRTWALNGQAFTWKDLPAYKPGYYATVAKVFAPYFQAINIGGSHNVMSHTEGSSVLFTPHSDQSNYEHQIKRTIALETWEATMSAISGGQTKDAIRQRGIIGTAITGTRSKTEFERQSLTVIERQVGILCAVEQRLKEARPDPDKPIPDRELANVLAMAVKDVENPEHKETTLLEAMLGQSVAVARAKGPQPVVAAIEQGQELAGD